ncbi:MULTISPECIES: YciI family protein [unclassified Streptomyces]|uniref:YciI family protein n=1 Tax=unclassified Streptomyces TaxID=2593676 RepID=UPI002DDC2719|nr:YciI family protein [Streptomyces sp. NBC_01775]WSB80068.1 YciI family protein [Streptomyces sp. NBC_01775]WSS40436.1 YciI family protein [Streptomyces sp. NBC_01187]
MKYMLMIMGDQATYDSMSGKGGSSVWTEADMRAMFAHMGALNDELAESGELVDANGLSAPSEAKLVTAKDGKPLVSDGPYGESKEVLAGYWILDVASEERAIEIAAKAYSCPVPEGVVDPPIVVQPVQEGGGSEM